MLRWEKASGHKFESTLDSTMHMLSTLDNTMHIVSTLDNTMHIVSTLDNIMHIVSTLDDTIHLYFFASEFPGSWKCMFTSTNLGNMWCLLDCE